MEQALYGPRGFYRQPGGPAAHFRTSVHASPLFASALLRLLEHVDNALGLSVLDVVDVGAGRGELLTELWRQTSPQQRKRIRFTGVEIASRPTNLPDEISWRSEIPPLSGLLIANEWLDNIPINIAHVGALLDTASDAHYFLVDPGTGREELGPPLDSDDMAWVRRWTQRTDIAPVRVEVGSTRDVAWSDAMKQLRSGAAIAIDYGTCSDTARAINRFDTLTGYREGQQVSPIPDGSCDITAHVHFESVAAVGVAMGAHTVARLTQQEALTMLGISASRPPFSLATQDPSGYLRALQRAGDASELIDPSGLGIFEWLIQTKHCTLSNMSVQSL